MASSVASLSYSVKGAYDDFINKLEDSINSSNSGFVKYNKPLSGRFKNLPNGRVEFETVIHLKDWRIRGTSQKRISVLVHIQEEIQCSDKTLVRSTVRVNYFDVSSNQATLRQSIHFDFGPAQACHPAFHAQITNEIIPLSDEQALEVDFIYDIEVPEQAWFNNAHIPTPDMTFSSVFLCLAADHVSPDFFQPLLDFFRQCHERFPKPIYVALKDSLIKSPEHLKSLHWFAHMDSNDTE